MTWEFTSIGLGRPELTKDRLCCVRERRNSRWAHRKLYLGLGGATTKNVNDWDKLGIGRKVQAEVFSGKPDQLRRDEAVGSSPHSERKKLSRLLKLTKRSTSV